MKNMDDIFNSEQQNSPKPPFDVPPGYFETFEERLEARINALEEKPNTRRTFIRILKPIAGLAASFLLIMLLIKYPLSKITSKFASPDEISSTEDSDLWREIFMSNSLFFDDKTLVNTIVSDETSATIDSDEMFAIMSSELNDYEVYDELYN